MSSMSEIVSAWCTDLRRVHLASFMLSIALLFCVTALPGQAAPAGRETPATAPVKVEEPKPVPVVEEPSPVKVPDPAPVKPEEPTPPQNPETPPTPGQPGEQGVPAAQTPSEPAPVTPGVPATVTAPEATTGETASSVTPAPVATESPELATTPSPEASATANATSSTESAQDKKTSNKIGSFSQTCAELWKSTGIYDVCHSDVKEGRLMSDGAGRVIMICVSLVLVYLAIAKQYEPLLLFPIGMGGLLCNIPLAGISEPGGFLHVIYGFGIETGLFPLLIFMGVGAMTDFGPLIANPRTCLMGAAAQFGIFTSLLGALLLTQWFPGVIDFSIQDAASIGIIGGADGPTAIFLSSRLSPRLLGSIAVAAYSYMALVPIIQPPIMRALTTEAERSIKMRQLRPVSKLEKIIFPLVVVLLCAILLPSAAPLIGALMFGNLAKECGVVNRLSDTMQNSLCNIVTIMLGLSVGSKLAANTFLTANTLGILLLGLIAFAIGTAAGVLLAKLMNVLDKKNPINPLIGAAGVSAVPMAARVANKVGIESDPSNFLLMHAMGPNVSGVIGSAVAAGLLLALLG